jgi:hypothetical protein
MIRPARFRALCAALGEVEERPHFDRAAFRTPARIFTTLAADGASANVLLPVDVQQLLVDSQPRAFARLAGGWGARGWTRIDLSVVDEVTCREVLREAHALAAAPAPRGKKTTAKKKTRARPSR